VHYEDSTLWWQVGGGRAPPWTGCTLFTTCRRVGEVGIGTSGVSPDAAHSRGEIIQVIVEGPVAIEGIGVYVSRGVLQTGHDAHEAVVLRRNARPRGRAAGIAGKEPLQGPTHRATWRFGTWTPRLRSLYRHIVISPCRATSSYTLRWLTQYLEECATPSVCMHPEANSIVI
jgi:hypothetical protein